MNKVRIYSAASYFSFAFQSFIIPLELIHADIWMQPAIFFLILYWTCVALWPLLIDMLLLYLLGEDGLPAFELRRCDAVIFPLVADVGASSLKITLEIYLLPNGGL